MPQFYFDLEDTVTYQCVGWGKDRAEARANLEHDLEYGADPLDLIEKDSTGLTIVKEPEPATPQQTVEDRSNVTSIY